MVRLSGFQGIEARQQRFQLRRQLMLNVEQIARSIYVAGFSVQKPFTTPFELLREAVELPDDTFQLMEK